MTGLGVLPHLVRRARRLIGDTDDTAACRLLAHGLADIDPVTATGDPRLIQAALTYIDALSFRPQIPDRDDLQLTWARYAQTAAHACYGEHDPRWQYAATVYARVCASQGLTLDAVVTRRRQRDAYRAHGPADRVPLAEEQFATALHADGQCTSALLEIHTTFTRWLSDRVPEQPAGGQLLSTYAALLAGCGHSDAAEDLLRRHAEIVAIPGTTHRESTALVIAVHITVVEREHPAVCTIRPRHRPPPAAPGTPTPLPQGGSQRWQSVLLNTTATVTASPLQCCSGALTA